MLKERLEEANNDLKKENPLRSFHYWEMNIETLVENFEELKKEIPPDSLDYFEMKVNHLRNKRNK